MPVFFVLAHDGTDAGATARRQAARAAHLERIKPSVADGSIVTGGAILNDAGDMVGSAFMAKMANRRELEAWIAQDPYTLGKVWQRVEIAPVQLVVENGVPVK